MPKRKGSNEILSTSDCRKLKKLKEEEEDLKRIIQENEKNFKSNGRVVTRSEGETTKELITSPIEQQYTAPAMDEDNKVKLVGEYVEVKEDTSPGNNRPKGFGFVTSCESRPDGSVLMSARIDGRIYHNIPLCDITITSLFSVYRDVIGESKQTSPRKGKGERKPESVSHDDNDDDGSDGYTEIKDWQRIVTMLTNPRNKKKQKGWLRIEMKLNDHFVDDTPQNYHLKNEALKMANSKSSKVQTVPHYNFREKAQIICDYRVLETYLDISRKNHYNPRGKKRKMKKKNPLTLTNLLYAWGTTKASYSRWKREAYQAGIQRGLSSIAAHGNIWCGPEQEDNKSGSTVIDDMKICKQHFSPINVYINEKMRQHKQELIDNGAAISRSRTEVVQKRKEFRLEYENLSQTRKEQWAAKSRALISRQPLIKDQLITLLQKDNSLSYEGLSNGINHWCNPSTIRRWITTREGFKMYGEQIIPLLSTNQKSKHLQFAERYLNNWGNGKGRYLLLHYDEKWFWGMLLRKTAKKFDGLDPEVIRCYHKNHISKTMGIAVVGIAFEDTLENGGEGLKIVFQRCQSAKVAKRKVSKNGVEVRKKGDIFYVDCGVTGTLHGTAKDPKFALHSFFKDSVFPAIYKLVKPGGPYNGYTPVFQGDNAGPHKDDKFNKFVTNHCKEKGWLWEPQGPQMPHINVLDLSIFPAMSRRHSHIVRSLHGTRIVKGDEIWESAVRVWDVYPSCKIANAFVQTRRIAEKIVKSKGGNSFLSGVDGGIAAEIRKDFNATNVGNKRKDQKKIAFQGTNNYVEQPTTTIKYNKDGSVEM